MQTIIQRTNRNQERKSITQSREAASAPLHKNNGSGAGKEYAKSFLCDGFATVRLCVRFARISLQRNQSQPRRSLNVRPTDSLHEKQRFRRVFSKKRVVVSDLWSMIRRCPLPKCRKSPHSFCRDGNCFLHERVLAINKSCPNPFTFTRLTHAVDFFLAGMLFEKAAIEKNRERNSS